jgi:hypothetical protein
VGVFTRRPRRKARKKLSCHSLEPAIGCKNNSDRERKSEELRREEKNLENRQNFVLPEAYNFSTRPKISFLSS